MRLRRYRFSSGALAAQMVCAATTLRLTGKLLAQMARQYAFPSGATVAHLRTEGR